MLKCARYRKKSILLALGFTLLFLISSTVTNDLEQLPYDSETYFPLIKNMTPALGSEDYVDSNLSDIDSSPDIGTHSSFANQQAGPDSTYDTLTEANGAPPPTNSEDDIDSATSDVDSTPDQGIEGTFTNAQGTALDSSYFAIQEESVISAYGGETGSVFVTGSVPDMAGKDQYSFYQAIFWNPTDDVYDVSRVEFSYTGSSWCNAIAQGSGSSSPTSEWYLSNKQVAYWSGSSPITVQPHTAYSFYVRGDSNRIKSEFYIDIRITANSSTYTESYHSQQNNRDRPAAQLWLGSSLPPSQIHSVSTGVQTTVYVSLEEDGNKADILSGGTLTIDVPTGFTGITDVGGTNWSAATINGNQIIVSNTAAIKNSYLTYAFQITSPSTPGLYKLDIAFDDGNDAHPIGNFTIHVTGIPPTIEKVNVEYQWSTATFGETYEEVCIYVGSHTGSENLTVNYWDGFTWNVLGTISATGWTNFTATGLTSSTYTIQLIGTTESSDSSKDIWNVDLITLHTWSTQTYNYKLDLEIQWTSANYTQDYEVLCIYAGSLATESIRVDVWNGAGWTNIASDLTPSSWNNFTITTWLTSSVFTIRFRGDIEVGDTTQSSWEIDVSLLNTWDNNIPQNTPTPAISNLDDTTYLYAQYRQYQLTADVSDGDGFADIDYFELTLTSDNRATEYWTIRYDEDTNSFTEQSDPSDYITLDNSSSSAIPSGNGISATFFITINWNHPDVSNTDLKSEVFDANPSSDSDYYKVNWDVETRLDISIGPTLNDGSGTINRGDLDGSMTASGTITYLGSSLHSAASDIDVWISSSEYGIQIGPWEATNYEDAGGTFSATVYADNLVGLDTFTFKAVEEGAGAGGSDLFVSSQSANYISDRVQVQSYSTDDSRINVDATANMHVTLYYDYDDSFVVNGTTVTVNGVSATYSGSNGVWDFSDTESTVQINTYDTVAYTGGTHGITVEDQNGQSLDQIWDRITVVSYSTIDDRVDVDTSVDIDVTLVYAYDSAAVTVGTVTVNTISATHQGGGVWRFSDTKATVQGVTYNLVAASGNTHEITLVDQNSQTQDVIWDQITVLSYSVLDDRVNLDDSVTINVTLEYAYNNTDVADGVVTINFVLASYQGNGVWQISTSRSTVQGVTYNSVVCSGNTHGITDVNQNGQSQLVIWDQITVRSYSVSDGRTNINDNVDIDVTIEYEYDDSPVINGTVTINGAPALHQSGGIWRITDSKATIQLVTYDTVVCSGNSLGITDVNQNSQSTQIIWDQITVRGYEVTDSRDNVGDTITITVELEYEYDDGDVVDGNVTVNSIEFTYTGSLGKWSADRMQVTVTDETFDSVVVSGNSFGITNVNPNGQSQTIIWDRIRVLTTLANDTRLSTGAYSEIRVTLQLEYDLSLLGAGDFVTLNGTAMTWDGIDSRFELNRQQLAVGQWLFYVNSSLESTYGISALNLNSQDVSVIWDEIRILTTVVDNPRVSVGTNVELRVTAVLAFDGHPLQSGDTIVMDSSSMNWDGVFSWFDLSRSQASVGLWTYQVDSAFEADYGISALDLNGQSQQVIWDQLTINIIADMDSVPNGIQVNFTVTVTFQYDSAPCTTYTITIARNATHWHTFTNANISSFFDTNSGVVYNYTTTLVVSETTYDITVFSTNTETVTWGGGVTAPVNDSAPVLTNPDDTDFMYARLRYYVITSNVSDAQGYATIDYVELSLWDNTRSIEIWRIRYTESTNAFSIELGSANITLAGSSYVKSLNDIDITWVLKIDWDHIDLSNVDIRQYVVDESAESDTNWYESDWNVETRLDYSVSPSLSDDRGDLNTNDLVMTGTVVYYGSSLNPHANETDVWILHDMSGTWSGNVSVAGAFSIGSIASSAIVRSNIYTVKVVIDGHDSGGTDLYYTSSVTTEFITDRIEFYLSGVLDGRINVNVTGTFWWNARYDYDDVEITGGLIAELNGSKSLNWDSINSRWYYSETIQSVSRVGYSVFSVTSESGYGLTGWTQTASDTSIIWDLVVVRSYSVTDSRVNITDSVDIDVLLEYEYDDSIVDNGTVTINSVSAAYQGSGIWRISESRSSVMSVTYNSVSCSGNTHGISLVNQNSQSETIIWDRLLVIGYSVTNNHVNVDDSVNIEVTLLFEFDSSPVTTGNVTINANKALHQGGGVWRISQTHSTAQGVTFDTVACNDTTYGITAIDQNGQSQLVIWDQIVVISYTVLDDRVNVGENVSIDVLLHYDYDGSQVTDGTVSINSVSAENQGSGVWRITVSELAVGNNTYDSVAASGNSFGITDVDQNSQSQQVIWDQVAVRSLTASDDRGDVGSTITVFVTLEYEHDDSDVTDGSVIINTVSFTYTGANGIWFTDRSQTIVTSETYDSVAVSGNNYGISNVDLGGASTTIIWDRIRILTTTVDVDRLSTNSTARIMVIAELEYDGTLLGGGDSLFLDDSLMTWDGGNGWFYLDVSQSSVGLWNYYVNTSGASESTYVISVVNTMGLSQDVIWDRLLITIIPDSVSVFDFTDVSFTLDVTFDFDSFVCDTYLVDVSRNGTYWKSFTSANISQFIDNNAAKTYQYTIQVVVDDTEYGITAFTSNTVEVTWTTPSNFAPFNNGAPTLVNPDDSDNLYSKLRQYFITSSIVDYDGYADVDYVELSLWDNSQLFEVWRVRYTSATNTFSIVAGSEYIHLFSGLNLSIGNLINVTWSIKIDWDHFDLQNIDVQQFVVDSVSASDVDWFESDWDIVTSLDYSIMPSLSDDWGDLDTADLQASGTVVYYGSSISPLTNETDVWVIHDFSGSWSGNINAIGELSVSGIGSSSIVRLNTYTFKIVEAGLGSASADLFYTTSPTSTFITDRIEFYTSEVEDSRINIYEMGDVWWSARYQYNGSDIQSGLTAYLNGINLLTWDTINSRWHYQEARTSAMQIVYQISSATETGLGITNWIDSTTNQTIIWDSLIISITDPFDQRTNVNTNATGIRVSAIYSYDSTRFDGTILLDNTTFQFSSVHRQYYTVASVSGDTHGIRVISVNDQTWCIWDQIEVVSIISNVTYMDPNEYARVQVTLLYDFDDAPVQDGTFSLKFEDLVHLADGIWEVNVTRLSYQLINFDTLTTCNATIFGITHFDLYGNDLTVYWDQLEIYESSAADSRIDVGSSGFSLWSLRLQNAVIDITSGITAQVTGSAALTYVNGYWRTSHTSDVVGDQTFTILSASLEGIDFFTISTNDVTIIWDRIQVLTTSATSTNPAIEQFIIITATLSYEYDGTEVTDGVVTLWDQDGRITMSYNSSGGFWYANVTKVETGNYTFYIEAVSGNQFGITGVSLNGNQIIIEFVPAPLPRLTPMMIAGIGTGFIAFVLISAILVRRRYYVEIPYEIKQIDAILEAMEKEEEVEAVDVKPAVQSVFDLLEPGMAELGLTMEEIIESLDDAELEEIHVSEPDAEIVEALEDFVIPEPEPEPEEEVVPREIPESESTGEFEELDVEAYTDMEAAAEEALALMLEEVRKVKDKAGVKVLVTKDDWIEKLPTEVKGMFFEEELKELELPDIEQLAKLSPAEVEELLNSVSDLKETDTIDPESSYIEIVDALKIKFDEIENEEVDEVTQKKRIIQSFPSFVIDHFPEDWLENLSIDDLKELTQVSEDELKVIIDALAEAKEPAKSEQLEEVEVEEIDVEEELRRLDLEEVEEPVVEEVELPDFEEEEEELDAKEKKKQ